MTDETIQRPPVRVALMGLGRSMFDGHVPQFRAHPELFRVQAACDLVKERRDRIAKDFPACKMFRQFGDMLDEREIDIVDIATCSCDHVTHALESLGRGRWTLLETPMALSKDGALVLRGAALKAKNRFIVAHRGVFEPDFLLAKMAMARTDLLGDVYEIVIRKEDYIRRDDWQTVKRLGGGAAYYEMTDLVVQALKLLPVPPMQMWSELKRVASLGDAEDFCHLNLRTRSPVSADIEYNGGVLAPSRSPSFRIRGERGEFAVMPGATEGVFTVLDPAKKLPRRRSSVRTPPLEDLHEELSVVTVPFALPEGTLYGADAFWRSVYDTVRTAVPFPVTLDESIEAVRFAQLMKQTSPFGK